LFGARFESENLSSVIVKTSASFDSRAKAPPAKRSEKGYGDEDAHGWRARNF